MNLHVRPWDSEFFSLRIGEFNLCQVESRKNPALQQVLSESGFDCIYVIDDGCITLNKLSRVFPSDWRVEGPFEKQVYARKLAGNNGCCSLVSEFRGTAEELYALSFESIHSSRFSLDPGFSGYRERYAEEWIRSSLSGDLADEIFVIRQSGLVDGMVSVKLHRCFAEVGLIAVCSQRRRSGYGRFLLEAAENYALRSGVGEMRIPTQAENTEAVAFYSSRGYSLRSRHCIYHLWRQ